MSLSILRVFILLQVPLFPLRMTSGRFLAENSATGRAFRFACAEDVSPVAKSGSPVKFRSFAGLFRENFRKVRKSGLFLK